MNLRCILLCFQVISGLNINLQKSELVMLRSKGNGDQLANALGCKIVNLSIKYLGLPLGAKFKDAKFWDPVIDLFERRLAK